MRFLNLLKMLMTYRTLFAAASVSACALMAATPPSKASGTRQCSNPWARPETLRTKTGAFVHVERPIGAPPAGKDFLLLGPRVVVVPAALDSLGPSPDVLGFDPSATLGGRVSANGLTQLARRPEFIRSTSTLWAFPDGSTGFHLIWGIPRDSAKSDGLDVSSVWYARFDGRNWSNPELVMRASRLKWWHGVSAVALSKDLLVVAAPTVDSGWTGIVASHRTASGWVTDRFTTRAGLPPTGVALAIRHGRAWLFYPDDTTRSGVSGSAIYSRELAPNGTGWTSEHLVHLLRPGGLNWPLAVESRDHRLHLFWVFTENGATVETLEHLSSSTLRTWRLEQLPIRARAFGLNVSALGKSSVQVVLQTGLFGGLAAALSTPGGLSSIEEMPFAKAIGSAPNLATTSTGGLLMTWSGVAQLESKKGAVPFPVTIYSSRTGGCS